MKKEFKIGIAAIAALIILFVGINYLKGINMFKSESYYYVDYTHVNGLALSSPVYANGFKVGLVRDIQYKDLEGYILTDSYDLAQEAAMFLCGYIGKNVYDTCIETKSGKTYTIRRLCSKVVCHKIYEILKIRKNTERAEDLHKSREPYVLLEEKKETDYKRYDEILSKLNLTKEEKETIDGYMAGISVTQQARIFNVYNSTIWRRRKRVQDKYLAIEVTL